MPSDATAARIEQLKGLHARWTAEFQRISPEQSERVGHLCEALNDLQQVIVDLEVEHITRPAPEH